MNWLPLLPFVFFFAWLLFSIRRQRQLCPECAHLLPALQSPFTKTARQWIEGGCVCRYCGCETDSSGNKVAPGTPPRTQSIWIGVSLVAFASLPAVAMLYVLVVR